MTKIPLPVVTGKDVRRYLERNDYIVIRVKGSHFIFKKKDGSGISVGVPIHGNRELAPGTLNNIIKFIAKNERITEEMIRTELFNLKRKIN